MKNITSRIILAWMCLFSKHYIMIKFHIKQKEFTLGGTVIKNLKTTCILLDDVSEKIKLQIVSDKIMKQYKEVEKLN